MTGSGAPWNEDAGGPTGKADWRRLLLARRRARPTAERSRAATGNAEHLFRALAGTRVVCAFLPLPSEPLDADLLDRLTAAGGTVLVPVVTGDGPLDWCRHPARTRRTALGIAEPVGVRLGPDAVRTAGALVVPALAVDRTGRRLGRGGGHYDRTLPLVTAGTEIVAVLFDDELVAALPGEAHDVAVTAVVTPGAGVRPVG